MRRCALVRHPATLAVFSAALFLTPLSALSAPWGPLGPVKLRVHGREVALKTPAVYDGREVYVPLDALNALNAKWVMTRREESVIVTPEVGPSFEVALARPGREPMVPFGSLNKQLRLPIEVRDGICDVAAPARKVEPAVKKEPVKKDPPAETAVPPAITPSRTDLKADSRPAQATPQPETRQPEIRQPEIRQPEIRQPETRQAQSATKIENRQAPQTNNDSRISIARKPEVTPGSGTGAVQISQPVDAIATGVALSTPKPRGELDSELEINLPPRGSPQALNPTAQPELQAPAPAATITELTYELVDEKLARLQVRYTGKPTVYTRMMREPYRLAIDFGRAAVAIEQREWAVDHPLFSGLHLVQGEYPGTARLVVDLTKLVGYSPNDDTPGLLTIHLMLPRGAGKRVQGRTIVIDPGHGGNQTGTSAVVNGTRIYEKNLTLDIAKRLHRLCAEAGIDALMTRTSDMVVGLFERPALANRNGADLFASIHIDDCSVANSASGSTAYYHMDDASSRALAFSVVERIGQVSGLPVRGAWSDRRRFPKSGMAVLRGSRVPATLIEIGYMNNSRDRGKLIDPEYRQLIAQAIFDGIKGYIQGDLPDDSAAAVAGNATDSY